MTQRTPAKRRKVLVVGGGAAGTAAAWSLSRSPALFDVSLWESAPVLGGVATTEALKLADGSVVAINDGVQGGAPSYRNCLSLHAALGGFVPQQVFMKVAFGKGGLTWSNVGAPSDLVRRMQPDIARFGRVLRRVDALPVVFAFVPIRRVLKLWRFHPDFGERLVYPLTALFFGTGNRTPEVSAAIIARVFLDPKLRLFDYSPERLLDSSPEMFAFQQLGDIYATAAEKLRAAGVDVRLNCACSRVQRFPGTANAVVATDATGAAHNFDAVIFACDAATALRLLERPGFWERHVLGSVRYYDDVTYTHSDEAYMREHYELHADAPDERPDYFIWSHPGDASKLEMSFDLGHYQPHLRSRPPGAPPIYQVRCDACLADTHWTLTVFHSRLRFPRAEHIPGPLGLRENLDCGPHSQRQGAPKKVTPLRCAALSCCTVRQILLVKWWRQFSHEASHFRSVVPFVRLAQGSGGGTTFYAGSWTLVNTHEVATVSGLAAAYRLGAKYPFAGDALAADQFTQYLSVSHGVSYR